MSSYKKIAEHIKAKHSVTIKSCYIAHCKEIYWLPRKNSHNRKEPQKRVYECPEHLKQFIKDAFIHFEMLKK